MPLVLAYGIVPACTKVFYVSLTCYGLFLSSHFSIPYSDCGGTSWMKHRHFIRKTISPERSSFARWRTTYGSIHRISSTPSACCGGFARPHRSFTKRCHYLTGSRLPRRLLGINALPAGEAAPLSLSLHGLCVCLAYTAGFFYPLGVHTLNACPFSTERRSYSFGVSGFRRPRITCYGVLPSGFGEFSPYGLMSRGVAFRSSLPCPAFRS